VHDKNNCDYIEYKRSTRIFRNELDKAYNEYMSGISNKLEESVDTDQKYIWALLKSRRKQQPLCRELKVNGKTSTSDEDICRAWSEHFETIYNYDTSIASVDHVNLVSNDVRDIRNLQKTKNELIKPFIEDEITQICTSLKINKSSGLDNISYEHIKYVGKTLYRHLCNLFNLVLMTLYTPSD